VTYNPLKRGGGRAGSGSVRLEGIQRIHRIVAVLRSNQKGRTA